MHRNVEVRPHPLTAQVLAETLDDTTVGVVVHDVRGEVLHANLAARRILGEPAVLPGDAVREDGTPLAPGADPVAVALRTGRPVRGGIVASAPRPVPRCGGSRSTRSRAPGTARRA